MTNRGTIHDLLPGWEPWKPEDHGGYGAGVKDRGVVTSGRRID